MNDHNAPPSATSWHHAIYTTALWVHFNNWHQRIYYNVKLVFPLLHTGVPIKPVAYQRSITPVSEIFIVTVTHNPRVASILWWVCGKKVFLSGITAAAAEAKTTWPPSVLLKLVAAKNTGRNTSLFHHLVYNEDMKTDKSCQDASLTGSQVSLFILADVEPSGRQTWIAKARYIL